MTNYIAPTVTDRGSVVARTLGAGNHQTFETSNTKRSTSLGTDSDSDPMSGKTYEHDSNGNVIVVGGVTSIASETSGDLD
jgi:hypothetical protein